MPWPELQARLRAERGQLPVVRRPRRPLFGDETLAMTFWTMAAVLAIGVVSAAIGLVATA